MTTLAALLLTVAGFGLFQALAARQPLAHLAVADAAGARDRRLVRALRLLAGVGPALGATTLAGVFGWAEGLLLELALLALVASGFVLLAPVAPRALWRLTLVAPVLGGALALLGGSRA